jgi:hypothetical protein
MRPEILKYRGDDDRPYIPLYRGEPRPRLRERYAAEFAVGNGGGDLDLIRMIVDAIEQTDWCQWVKHQMRSQATAGATVPPPGPPPEEEKVPREFLQAERFRRLGPPTSPEAEARSRHYARPATEAPVVVLPAPSPRREQTPLQMSRHAAGEVEQYRRKFNEANFYDDDERQRLHYQMVRADVDYRQSRAELSERARRHAETMGVSYETALERMGFDQPADLVGATAA